VVINDDKILAGKRKQKKRKKLNRKRWGCGFTTGQEAYSMGAGESRIKVMGEESAECGDLKIPSFLRSKIRILGTGREGYRRGGWYRGPDMGLRQPH